MRVRPLYLLPVGILLLAVVFAPVGGHTRWIYALHDAAHGPIFGCIAVLLMRAMRGHVRFNWGAVLEYALAFVLATVLGGVTEVLQYFVGRDASLADFRNDVLGTLAFLLLFAAMDSRLHRNRWQWRLVLLALATPPLLMIASPLTDAFAAYARRAAAFPALAEFSQRLDRYFLRVHSATIERVPLPARFARNAPEYALLVRFGTGDYPGIALIEPQPDWREYETLAVDVTNPTDAELNLVLRVHDERHNNQHGDRFNTRLAIQPKSREIFRVPLEAIRTGPRSRALDLANVAGVVLFATADSKARQMYVAGVWLEGGDGVTR
jgi:hypothetical protein